MAAAELTPIVLSRAVGLTYDASGVLNANTVDFDSSTGFYIDLGDTTQVNDASRLVIFVSAADSASTFGGLKILSSTEMPYVGSGITDLAIDLSTAADTKALDLDTASTAQVRLSAIGPLESARFKDTDGYLNVEYDTDHAGAGVTLKAWAVVLP